MKGSIEKVSSKLPVNPEMFIHLAVGSMPH